MWLMGLWVIIATLYFYFCCLQETICFPSHLDTLLVMQTIHAADTQLCLKLNSSEDWILLGLYVITECDYLDIKTKTLTEL